jgi:hypothetical protein
MTKSAPLFPGDVDADRLDGAVDVRLDDGRKVLEDELHGATTDVDVPGIKVRPLQFVIYNRLKK